MNHVPMAYYGSQLPSYDCSPAVNSAVRRGEVADISGRYTYGQINCPNEKWYNLPTMAPNTSWC